MRASLGWVALALLGLVVAAAISLAASRLSSQHIGLSAEPLTEGSQLAPSEDRVKRSGSANHHRSAGHRSQHGTSSKTTTSPASAPPPAQTPSATPSPPPAVAPQSGSGGSGGGDDSGRDDSGHGGHGGDD
ncbi:MAG TPA: hypothetical protein VH817_13070 [Thermoleophilaceae bacterium]